MQDERFVESSVAHIQLHRSDVIDFRQKYDLHVFARQQQALYNQSGYRRPREQRKAPTAFGSTRSQSGSSAMSSALYSPAARQHSRRLSSAETGTNLNTDGTWRRVS